MSQDDHGYKFFAVIDEGRTRIVKKIVASKELEAELAAIFEEQAAEFLDPQVRRIPFDPRYTADTGDLFNIAGFDLPDTIKSAVTSSAQVDNLDLSADCLPTIKSVFAARKATNAVELRILFQKFNRSRMLRPGIFTLLLRGGTFEKLADTGITLDTQLVAAFEGDTLLFRSYPTVSAFLDLTNYFVEATDADIALVAEHANVIVDDRDALIAMSDSQIRKKFSVIKSSGILDKAPVRSIVTLAKDFDLTIAMKRPNGVDQFVLPKEKRELKRFLTFLCEGYFKGTLTQERYETNSHRKI